MQTIEYLHHDELTMHKVYDALRENGLDDSAQIAVVNSMQNRGILFRENPR